MAQKESKAVEILPMITDVVYGSIKTATCRVTKNGSNIAMPKVTQPNKQGRNQGRLTKGAEKWRSMSDKQKIYWKEIATEHNFWSNWTAFMSSFMISVTLYGLDYVMANDVEYLASTARLQRHEQQNNMVKRRRRYKVDASYYPRTEKTMRDYPIQQDSPLIYVRLLDLTDVNNALALKMIYRTDAIVEYQYFPDQVGEIEKGYYIKTGRPREGDELYEPLL